MILSTIGYEAATLPEVIARLRDAGVALVLDVRAVAAFRLNWPPFRPGTWA
ncbi:hypothetical protein [Rubellimicrobium aerolatum]|uniref:DUF488 domain-containing protein n=1 Tax=Rubellimicrobium aerolatum TaxID=490979 RepID=A0ABW0S9I7_9RHOB|nr:hypothetical protein [Rubellimicrobium aerolatum]MBP1804957.1 uncharacterized protein (DUF488 family) [Rubellimicrobium aerolatum]